MQTTDDSVRDGLGMSRRMFTAALPALLLAPRVHGQPSGIRLRKLNSFEIRVSDVDASVRFYQGLFGMPVQARSPERVCLRIGEGPQFMAVRPLLDGEAPAITHLGYSVEDFAIDRIRPALQSIGFERIEPPPISAPGIEHAMKTWVRARGETEELYFSDPRGLIVQLTDPSYCGGAGALGNRCERIEEPPEGLMRLNELNHFTVF